MSNLFTRLQQQLSSKRSQRRTRKQRRPLRMESLETRQLLAADGIDDLMMLSDEFDDSSSIVQWQRINEVEGWNADQLEHWDVDGLQSGAMTMIPRSVVWFQNYRGPMVFQEVAGNFVFTTDVEILDRDDIGASDPNDVPGDGQFSLGGLMIRTPRAISDPADWVPGSMAEDGTNTGENYVFLSMGYGNGSDQFSLEVKTTRNSNSQLELTPLGPDANSAKVQIARIGDAVIALYQLPGEPWQVHRRYSRPDMPETLQVGLVTYTDWEKANDFDPFYHNGHALNGDFDPTPETPFNPDLVAHFDYARYVRPDVPESLQGEDLSVAGSNEDLLAFLGENANTPAVDPEQPSGLPTIGDQSVLHDRVLEIILPDELNGQPLSYEVGLIGDLAYQLDQDHNLTSDGDYFEDWGGRNERWLQGDAGWYFLLPGGGFYQWTGSFEGSTALGELGAETYDDPSLLHDAQAAGAAVVSNGLLTITPTSGFVGEIQLIVAVSDGVQQSEQSVFVSVTNETPVLESIADQSMQATQDSMMIGYVAVDNDNDALEITANVVQSEEYELDQHYGFQIADDYFDNWGGQGERWIQDGEGDWYFLLPDGSLNQWTGAFEASSQISQLDPGVYNEPSLLTDPQAIAVAAEVIGDQVVVDPDASYSGEVEIRVTADDGIEQVETFFTVAVVNQAPILNPIPNQQMLADELILEVPIIVEDPDGGLVEVEAIVVDEAYALDQALGLWSEGDYFENWGGQQERWLRDADNAWYYLLPTGNLHRWEGSFESSELVASLDVRYYDDPMLLADAEPILATASYADGVLTIERDAALTGGFEIRVRVSDGIESVQQLFTVAIA